MYLLYFLLLSLIVPVEKVDGPLSSPADELNAAFTPDGDTVYFTRKQEKSGTIMVMHRTGTGWSTPQVAAFSGQYPDYDPFVTLDGTRLYWISQRPVDGVAREDLDIWMVERQGKKWGPPRHLPAPVNSSAGEFYPTVARNGTLYFSSNREGGRGRGDLYRSRLEDGAYRTISPLGDAINSPAFEGDPFISADERLLIFTGWGRVGGDKEGDLFISRRSGDGWSAPRRLPDGINSSVQEYAPIVSPDGAWFYFTSYRGEIAGDGNVYRLRLTDLEAAAASE